MLTHNLLLNAPLLSVCANTRAARQLSSDSLATNTGERVSVLPNFALNLLFHCTLHHLRLIEHIFDITLGWQQLL